MQKSLLLIFCSLALFLPVSIVAQVVISSESFETDGEGTRYNSNAFNNAGLSDYWGRTNTNPAPYHSQTITAGTRDGSWYWSAEDVQSTLGFGVNDFAFVTLNGVNVAGFTSLDVQIALGISRFGQNRWENDDYVMVEYNMDGGGWNAIGLFMGNNATTAVGGQLRQDTDNSTATFGPFGTEVTGTFADFTLPIPVTGNSVQIRVRTNCNGSEEPGFDYIRIRGIASANSAPVLANIEGTSIGYSEGDPATQITNAITVTDADDTNLSSATVSISTNFDGTEDMLAFTSSGGITGSFNTGTGILSLSGTSSLANYQTVLRSVTYQNTDAADASSATRTISFQVNDGTDNSNTVTRNIDISTSLNGPAPLPFSESFEANGEGTTYESDDFSSGCTFAERGAAGTNVGGCFAEIITGANGSFVYNTENTDANGGFTLTSQPLDITGLNNFTIQLLIGVSRDTEARWENDDQVRVEYSVDGGSYTIVGLFTGNNASAGVGGGLQQDSDNDPGTFGPFTGAIVPDAFTNYTFSFTATGSNLQYRIVVNSNGTEELAFDNVLVSGVTLPVELINFQVSTEKQDAFLSWTVAREENNHGYFIERGEETANNEAVVFEEMGFVAGQGTINSPYSYTYVLPNQDPGQYAYRLRQIDLDGRFTYSEIVRATIFAESQLLLYPNPVKDIFQIELQGAETDRLVVSVVDMFGKVVSKSTFESLEVGNHRMSLDVSRLPTGKYLIEVNTGKRVIRERIVKW